MCCFTVPVVLRPVYKFTAPTDPDFVRTAPSQMVDEKLVYIFFSWLSLGCSSGVMCTLAAVTLQTSSARGACSYWVPASVCLQGPLGSSCTPAVVLLMLSQCGNQTHEYDYYFTKELEIKRKQGNWLQIAYGIWGITKSYDANIIVKWNIAKIFEGLLEDFCVGACVLGQYFLCWGLCWAISLCSSLVLNFRSFQRSDIDINWQVIKFSWMRWGLEWGGAEVKFLFFFPLGDGVGEGSGISTWFILHCKLPLF